ncbi:QRFP-like peptide receptor [Saccoglossus kowalevskii]
MDYYDYDIYNLSWFLGMFNSDNNNGNHSHISSFYNYDYVDLAMSREWQTILIIACCITVTLSITGNAAVIVVLLCGHCSCRGDLNAFLLNLAVSDLTMAVFSMPFTFTTIMYGHWIFGKVMCPATLFILQVSVCVSIYTLTSIGIDRYYAVVHPLKLRPSKYRNRIVILIIWVISVLSGIVQLVMGGTKRYFWDGQFFYTCSEGWPTETSSVVYETFVMCMTYFVPLLVLSFTYIKVGCRLWGRQLPGNANQARDRSHMRSTRKVIKMLVVVLLMFALCWIPLHIFNIIQRVHRDLKQHEIIRAVNAILLWIAMSNSFVNPIIYSFMNDSFRKELYFLLCFCCRWRGRKRNISSSRARKFRLQQRSQRNAYSTVTVSSKLTQSGPISKRERASITTGEQNERENIEDWLVMKTNNLIITTN